MNRADAITIVEGIVHGWPGGSWDVQRMEAYVDAIMPLDAAVTTRAMLRARNQLRYRPSIAELREFVQVERRLSEADEVRLMPVENTVQPVWVARWRRARREGDMRPFPEQMTAMDKLARQGPEDYRVYNPPAAPVTDRSVWVGEDEYLDDDGAAAADAIVVFPDVDA